ncbi:MAPK/MAK/MRK overlapping kinase-like isoform X2 [Symsagittifera roscoffensis]|uniref:MAPK/MAK/MRK overlapping kinase-like isoform X2 n=1 Tax=Symsagittifera roscoffensis TaxID=84072 RepID=UPI00307C06E4
MAIYAKENADSRAAQSTQRGNRDAVQAKEGNLLSKYMVVSKKGEGTFSEVLECRNRSNDESVAVKKLKQRYDSIYQCNKIREVQAMRKLSSHANIVKLKEMIFEPTSCTLYLVMELMDMNLYELIRGKRHYLPESRVRFYMLQLVDAVRHMHKHGIFHRDVKPENILVKGDLLKLADFGSCRSRESKQPFTEYISTRWYRAPECLLTDGYYDYKMDVWSVGCVYFEISTLKPLFPGQNEIDQIDKIHKLFGTPPPEVLSKFKRSRSMSFNFPPCQRDEKTLTHLVEPMPSDGVELMYRMLEYDPARRVGMDECLQHAYLKTLRSEVVNVSGSELMLLRSNKRSIADFMSTKDQVLFKPTISDQLRAQREAKRQQAVNANQGGGGGGGLNSAERRSGSLTNNNNIQQGHQQVGGPNSHNNSSSNSPDKINPNNINSISHSKSMLEHHSPLRRIYRSSSLQKKNTRHRTELQPFFASKYAGGGAMNGAAPNAIGGGGTNSKRLQLSNSFLSHTFNQPAFHGTTTNSKYLQGSNPGGGGSNPAGIQLPYLGGNSNNYQVSYQRYQNELKKKPNTLPQSNLPKIEG